MLACEFRDQVAVLGGEFDDLMASISNPPLSTIDQPAEQIGYMAAEMLAGMMRKKRLTSPCYFLRRELLSGIPPARWQLTTRWFVKCSK